MMHMVILLYVQILEVLVYEFLHSGFEDWCKWQVKTENEHRVNDTDNQPIGRHVFWGLTVEVSCKS